MHLAPIVPDDRLYLNCSMQHLPWASSIEYATMLQLDDEDAAEDEEAEALRLQPRKQRPCAWRALRSPASLMG